MQNFLLQIYCLSLYDEIAEFLSKEKESCKVALIENNININKIQIVNIEKACQKYSLPCVTFNQELQIITSNFETVDFNSPDNFDVVLSLFNFHALSKNEQIRYIKKMREIAPRALFFEYENPERNLAYSGYFPFILNQYIVCFLEKVLTGKKNSVQFLQEYLKNGAVEGIIYELPQLLPDCSIKILERRHYGSGGVGMAYIEWK